MNNLLYILAFSVLYIHKPTISFQNHPKKLDKLAISELFILGTFNSFYLLFEQKWNISI